MLGESLCIYNIHIHYIDVKFKFSFLIVYTLSKKIAQTTPTSLYILICMHVQVIRYNTANI